MDNDDLADIAMQLDGSCESVETVVERMGLPIDPEDLEELLSEGLDVNRCPYCGWWVNGDVCPDCEVDL